MPVTSRTFSVRSAKLLRDETLGSVILRLMMAMNDLSMTSYSLQQWRDTTDSKEKERWYGGLLYFGRIQSAHLFEALSIIKEIEDSPSLMAAVSRADPKTGQSFATVAAFLGTADHRMLAKMRNVIAFHYEPKVPVRRLRKIVDQSPDHSMTYTLGSSTLDWHFPLGDLVADEIVIRDVFQIPPEADLAKASIEVLNRLRVIVVAFLDFAGYFVRDRCAN